MHQGAADAMGDGTASFADSPTQGLVFQEQLDFLRQKIPLPTRVWTDAMRGMHDRAFVVAGVTDKAMLEEFHQAVLTAVETRDLKGFGKEFDRLVDKYGWAYNGGRDWRVRTIFNTNVRTSYMAGRLKQMRDPDVVKLRPFWQYIHADTRVPLNPRPEHVAWDRLVLRWDDPWWNTHFPPNDWLCSCGVRSLSEDQLARLGKTGPDTAPPIKREPYVDKLSGQTVMQPEGIGFGWDYMPGDEWQRGLVSELIETPPATLRHVEIDPRETIDELRAKARPFTSEIMADGLKPEEYAAAFLEKFGLKLGEAKLWKDVEGSPLLINEDLFRGRNGDWKAQSRGHGDHALLIAETIMDPDEIWVALRALPDPTGGSDQVYAIVRRYIRVDPTRPVFGMFELGRRIWFPVTAYGPLNRAHPDFDYIDRQRVGKLIWKRK